MSRYIQKYAAAFNQFFIHVGMMWIELSFEIENPIHEKCELVELSPNLMWIELNFFSNYSLWQNYF